MGGLGPLGGPCLNQGPLGGWAISVKERPNKKVRGINFFMVIFLIYILLNIFNWSCYFLNSAVFLISAVI
jgi:hypothetical protein